jgi:hypothetical protein
VDYREITSSLLFAHAKLPNGFLLNVALCVCTSLFRKNLILVPFTVSHMAFRFIVTSLRQTLFMWNAF